MTRHQYFRDSVGDNEHEYDMQGFARFHARLFGGNGISNTQNDENIAPYDDFEVKATSGMDIELGSGYAAANGFMLEEDTPQTMTLDTSDPDHDRIDRVVLRFDTMPEKAEFKPVILKGKPDSSPKPPDLTKDNYTYELYVAQVRVRADRASLDDDDITDERNVNRLPIDNLQRGVQVNENGVVFMPNQSYVEIDGNLPTIFEDDEDTILPMDSVQKDRQNEVSGDSFVANTEGVYLLFGYAAFTQGDIPLDTEVALSFFVNGEYITIIDESNVQHSSKNLFSGSSATYLMPGDKLQFVLRVNNRQGKAIQGRNLRLRIIKLY